MNWLSCFVSTLLFSILSQAASGGVNDVKIGAYLDPSYIGSEVSYPCIYTNGTSPVMSSETNLNFNFLSKKWRYWDYQQVIVPDKEKTSDNGAVIPFIIDQDEMDLIYGPFVDVDPADGLIDFEDDVWARIRGIQALKEVWADNPTLFPDFMPPTGYVVDPVPLTTQGGLGYYANEDFDTVRRQKELAHNYGIDYFTLEWYTSYDSAKNLWVDRKTAAIDVFFTETAPEHDFQLALNWVYKKNLTVYEFDAVQYLDEESARAFADRLQNYTSNSQYLKVDGDPVFFIYNAADMILDYGAGTVSNFLNQLRINLGGLTVVAYAAMNIPSSPSVTDAGFDWSADVGHAWTQEPNYTNYSASMASMFSEKTSYHGLQQMVDVSARPHPELVYAAGSAYYRQNQALNVAGGLWGYFRQEYPGTMPDCDNTPARFRSNMATAINYAANLNQAEKHVLIHSWNIWAEASPIEPTVRDGFKYLDAVKEALTTNVLQYTEQYMDIPLFNEGFTNGLPADWYYKTTHWDAVGEALEFDRMDSVSWATYQGAVYNTNCEFEVDIKILDVGTGGGYAGLQICKADVADGIAVTNYNIRVTQDGKLRLYNCWTLLEEADLSIDSLQETLRLKVRFNAGWIVVFINDVWCFSIKDTDYPPGYVGVFGGNCKARFDNFEVYPLRLNN